MARDPRELNSALTRVVNGLSGATSGATGGGSAVVAVFGCWDTVVGEQVAGHARPRRLSDGVLRVDVDEPGWATQLRYLRGNIIAEINEHLGSEVVVSIDLRVVSS